MRTEKEMYDLILEQARDDRVRVAVLNGSRANPNAPRDAFQDYDVVFLVTEMDSYRRSDRWLEAFGELAILQKPQRSALFPAEGTGETYLMQFRDGNRIDLTLLPLSKLEAYLAADSQTALLLDKDGRVAHPPVPSDVQYHIRRPTAQEYSDCCNEFWWTAPYVAKGLCRGELLYAVYHMNECVRCELLRMLAWRMGFRLGFDRSAGKCGKYLPATLSPQENALLEASCRMGGTEECREALRAAATLFRDAAREVSGRLETPYPQAWDDNVTALAEGWFRGRE